MKPVFWYYILSFLHTVYVAAEAATDFYSISYILKGWEGQKFLLNRLDGRHQSLSRLMRALAVSHIKLLVFPDAHLWSSKTRSERSCWENIECITVWWHWFYLFFLSEALWGPVLDEPDWHGSYFLHLKLHIWSRRQTLEVKTRCRSCFQPLTSRTRLSIY